MYCAGSLEAHRLTGAELYLEAGCRTADALLSTVGSDGYLPGRLDGRWNPAVNFVC